MKSHVDSKYFDYAASAPPWPEALEVFAKISRLHYGNPSSLHQHGKAAKLSMMELKKEFCDLIRFYDGRLLLTSSGSEANNTIVNGYLSKHPDAKILIGEDVHDSIWYVHEKRKKNVLVIPVDSGGQYNLTAFKKTLEEPVSLVCINHAGHETGAIQPVGEIAEICNQKNIKLLIDGAQAVGHIALNLDDLQFTYYTFAGYKFGSVRGAAGVLFRDDDFDPIIFGGKQEWGKRAGSENVAALASAVVALSKSIEMMDDENKRLRTLKEKITEKIQNLPGAIINSKKTGLPGLVSVSFPGFSGREITSALAMSGIAVSTGSACHSNQMEPSRIMMALGHSPDEALGSIRISMGVGTTEEAVDALLLNLAEIVN